MNVAYGRPVRRYRDRFNPGQRCRFLPNATANVVLASERNKAIGPSPGCGSRHILGMRVDATTYRAAAQQIVDWAARDVPRYVCVANVHMTMESVDDCTFRAVVNGADLVTPDGMPLVWVLRRRGIVDASRVYGPTLTLHICEAAARNGIRVGFYGGTTAANAGMVGEMTRRYPSLDVVYAASPPFRPLTKQEDEAVVGEVLKSGARILFVALGCPRQERWMAEHRDRLPVVQVGVGAAFALHAGELRQAPGWIQRLGMEWAFRLAVEPRRLWKRYLIGNSRFVWLLAKNALLSTCRGRQARH